MLNFKRFNIEVAALTIIYKIDFFNNELLYY